MKIGEIARLSGFQASTLRYYESIGLLPPPKRVGGQRRYEKDTLTLLKLIKLGQSTGFSLDEIRELIIEPTSFESVKSEWRATARNKIDEVTDCINRYSTMKNILEWSLKCDCVDLEACATMVDRMEMPNSIDNN